MVGLIIFGMRGVTYSAAKGDFHCPACGSQQPFNHKRVRRFFTLYFIPVIPLDVLGEYVECGGCAGTFKPEVLQLDPGKDDTHFEAEFHHAIKRVMVLMMLADGAIEPDEIDAILRIYAKLAGTKLTEESIRAEATLAQREGLSVNDYLGGLLGSLNDSGKEMVVRAAYLVAISDGAIPDEEMQLLREVGKALQMPNARFNALLNSMTGDDV